MYEGLRWGALRDPNPDGEKHPARSDQPHRAGADGLGGHRRGPVGHQLHCHPSPDLCSVSFQETRSRVHTLLHIL